MTSPHPSSPPPGATGPGDEEHGRTQGEEGTSAPAERTHAASCILWKLYLSHTLSTWNARTFEFGAVLFLAAIFPGTLFYASCYALFRSLAAFVLASQVGAVVDTRERLWVVRQSIVWQRCAVACSCLVLLVLLDLTEQRLATVLCFAVCTLLACMEKLAFVGNTVAVERDWLVVVADSLELPREDLNSAMRRIDLICKLMAPTCISLVDGYSTRAAVWVVFGQNASSVVFVSDVHAHPWANGRLMVKGILRDCSSIQSGTRARARQDRQAGVGALAHGARRVRNVADASAISAADIPLRYRERVERLCI